MEQILQALMRMNSDRSEKEAQAIIDDMSMIITDKKTGLYEMGTLEVLLDRGTELWSGGK